MSASIRLHLGCGETRLEGFVNIDVRETCATDVVRDVTDLSCYGDESVARIETYHMIEHLSEADGYRLLRECWRILRPLGVIVIECPNIKACGEALHQSIPNSRGWRMAFEGIYGQRYATDDEHGDRHAVGLHHQWGYCPATLVAALHAVGFKDMSRSRPHTHTAWRDMRYTAIKPKPVRDPACVTRDRTEGAAS